MAATSGLRKFRRQLFRRGQTGQSLIILAIGFIALLGFVGIVTDVSLLFVRYSTLRRAVDAAAVAAAGQMRRTPGTSEGQEQATSFANLNLAARQFIEIYGLQPSQVLVETCYTQNLPMIRVGTSGVFRPADRSGVPLYTYSSPNPDARKTGNNAAANAEDRRSYEELCKDNEVKLVRVSAQIDSPTVFLRLLGFPTITLTESSISQTAVLDVVLILDVSESMSYGTTYEDWEEQGYYYRYIPPYAPELDRENWNYWNSNSLNQILSVQYQVPTDSALLGQIPYTDSTGAYVGQPIYGPVNVDAGTVPPVSTWIVTMPDGTTREQTGPTVRFLPAGVTTSNPVREGCQVRVAPNSAIGTAAEIPPWLMQEYTAKFGTTWVQERFRSGNRFSGLVPTYRSYACCNDPDGNGDFADLVCQPFQQVRDATDQFLNNLDFIRGDRVAFVTFDASAHIIDPDGTSGSQRPMIEIEEAISGETPAGLQGARDVLETRIGVRAEPTYYADSNNDGVWDGLMDYDPSAYVPGNPAAAWRARAWGEFQTTITQDIYVQPTTGSCFMANAMLLEPQVPINWQYRAGRYYPPPNDTQLKPVEWPLLAEAVSSPSWFWDANTVDPDADLTRFYDTVPHLRSAEYRAGCGSGNIGGALNRAQEALVEGGRTEGTVWLMVLLSDGASGVTDPIARNIDDTTGAMDLQLPNPYNVDSLTGLHNPEPGDYGAFGACPYGIETNYGEVLRDSSFFPYCSDKDVDMTTGAPQTTRHFCSAMPMPPTQFELDHVDCDEEWYDADDYARDWADWVALSGLEVDPRYPVARSGNEQLPTIFTIGIGLDYSPFNSSGVRVCADDDWNCRRRQNWALEDYLGEQLLRYIADAGDNFQIDDDYWQCVMGARLPNGVIDCGDKVNQPWGPRGPCEVQTSNPLIKGTQSWLDPKQSCGNYFAAAAASDLERVFNIIASRMFTRLSQ